MNKEEIMVSICCITYNHEKYIRQALDGFLMQKTNFKFEIVIHDDASTDSTQDIIREYEKKYPDIIKPIYQVENQHSKGEKASLISYSHAIGKYIAVCEGDDYWIDENKLQEQVDYMENNEKCTFCLHDALVLDMSNNEKLNWPWYNKRFYKKDGNYNAGELDLFGTKPTASYMFRRQNVEKIPDWFKECVVGDRPLELIMTSLGYAHYINKVMSIYRIGSGNSTMDKINKENEQIQKAIKYWGNIEWIIDQFNSFSGYKYEKELSLSKNEIQRNILLAKKDYKQIIKEKRFRETFGRKERIKFFFKAYFPEMYENLKKRLKK